MRRHPAWQTVLHLYDVGQVSPISDWPDGWAAWATDGLTALHWGVERAKANKLKEATSKTSQAPRPRVRR